MCSWSERQSETVRGSSAHRWSSIFHAFSSERASAPLETGLIATQVVSSLKCVTIYYHSSHCLCFRLCSKTTLNLFPPLGTRFVCITVSSRDKWYAIPSFYFFFRQAWQTAPSELSRFAAFSVCWYFLLCPTKSRKKKLIKKKKKNEINRCKITKSNVKKCLYMTRNWALQLQSQASHHLHPLSVWASSPHPRSVVIIEYVDVHEVNLFTTGFHVGARTIAESATQPMGRWDLKWLGGNDEI